MTDLPTRVLATRECECTAPMPAMGQKRPECCEAHGNRLFTPKQLASFDKPRSPIRAISKKREAEEHAGTRKKSHGSTLSRGKGFKASPAQRKKVKLLPCLACGFGGEAFDTQGETGVDPAHVWPRGQGGCNHPDCVIPLCRSCHDAFDLGQLDLLPILAGSEAWADEQAHPIAEHGVGLVELVKRLGGNQTEVISTPTTSGAAGSQIGAVNDRGPHPGRA